MRTSIRNWFLAAALPLAVASTDASAASERECAEAERAVADATERYVNATNKSAKDAWLQAQVAAVLWRKKVCPVEKWRDQPPGKGDR